MEGDFKRPAQRPDGIIGGRPQPQFSQRPWPVTDLHPPSQPPAYQPTPQSAANPVLVQPAPQPAAPTHEPSKPLTTAELIAQHQRDTGPKPNTRRNLVLAVIGLVVVVGVGLLFTHRAPAGKRAGALASISASQITIPVYTPKNLPAGFKVSGYNVVKQDVLNYVVTNANNDSFYVNIQAIPAGYDFNAFNKRFTSPTTYSTAIGTATQGLMNNQLVCSIQTAKSWLMINSTATKSTADMQTIAKALQPASL